MTALMFLGVVVLSLGSGIIGWLVAARRHQAVEASLRAELSAHRASAEQSQARHEVIVAEVTRTALQALRAQGDDEQ